MFFLVLYLSLTSLSSLPVWREDARVFLADRGSGVYGTSAYVASVVLFDIIPYRYCTNTKCVTCFIKILFQVTFSLLSI